jgi:VMA21-like domain
MSTATAESSQSRVWTCRDILAAEDNRATALKLLRYSALMVTVPLTVYFVAREQVFAGLSENAQQTCSGLCAVLAVNCVIGAFIYEAFVVEAAEIGPEVPVRRLDKTD